jgi:predicted phosphodiesterase
MKEKSDRQKRNIRVSVTEEEYKLVREILHKTKGVGRKAKVDELSNMLGDWSAEFPDGDDEIRNPLKIEGKTAVLSDIHLGVHDKNAILAALRYIKREKPEVVILNGDVIDSSALSFHARTQSANKYLYEIELAKTFLRSLQIEFPNTKIIFKEGNHETRLSRYIMQKAAELEGVLELTGMLGLQELGIEFVEETRFIQHGKIFIIHGHELKVSGGVNPARALLLRAFSDCIMGHVHRTSFAHGKNMQGRYIRTWTSGCLCKLQQGYMPHSQSNHGFAIIEEDGLVRNHWILDGGVE